MSEENKNEINTKQCKNSKKKIIKRIIIILAILVIGFIVISLLPFLWSISLSSLISSIRPNANPINLWTVVVYHE